MKRVISIFLLLLSALVIFNLCFYACVDYDGNTRAWICYSFFHLAYFLSMLGGLFMTRRRFIILNRSLAVISVLYLIITTMTCLVFLLCSNISKEIETFVFSLELLFYLIYFHYCYLTNRKAEKGIVMDLKNASKHDNWITEIRFLMDDDEEKKGILNSIIAEINSSPSFSNPYVYDVDNEIKKTINSLKVNYKNMQATDLVDYKRQLCLALKKRTEFISVPLKMGRVKY